MRSSITGSRIPDAMGRWDGVVIEGLWKVSETARYLSPGGDSVLIGSLSHRG